MNPVSSIVTSLVDQAIEKNMIDASDRIYSRNQVLGLIEETEFNEAAPKLEADIPTLLEKLADIAVNKGLIENLLDSREMLTAKIMDVFLSKPSEVNRIFYEKYKVSPEQATCGGPCCHFQPACSMEIASRSTFVCWRVDHEFG